MRQRLRAGAAVYNAGHRHAAHDLWEERWLDLRDELVAAGVDPPATASEVDPKDSIDIPSTVADERLLHGLIQFTAAAHHLTEDNPAGAAGLADSAGTYLAALPPGYRGVSLETVRGWLDRVATSTGSPPPAPPLRHGGEAVALEDLDVEAGLLAAPVVAEATGYDPDPVVGAADYAREEAQAGTARFTTLVMDFVTGDDRDLVYRRLAALVARERRRDRDVDGLFR